MPLLGSDDQQVEDDEAFGILEKVELQSFNAAPANIGPFGASVLSWNVKGPAGPPAFVVELANQTVAKSGEQVVQPLATTLYQLTARVRRVRKPLGSVRVAVDNSACQVNPIVDAKASIEGPINVQIKSNKDLYFLAGRRSVATFSPGRIRMQLQLGVDINNFPDATVSIDASFGLAVHDGNLEATNEQISVDVSVPGWTWLIPGAALGIAISEATGKDRTQREMHKGILGIVALLNLYLTPQKGFRRKSVRVDDGNNGTGIIETTECPYGLLKQFAGISEATIL
jgi:hypothetical protein